MLLGSPYAQASEPVRLEEDGYRFDGKLYEAVVDRHGRLASLRVNGQEVSLVSFMDLDCRRIEG